jgi:DNA-binding GntR family transcriptional regulator
MTARKSTSADSLLELSIEENAVTTPRLAVFRADEQERAENGGGERTGRSETSASLADHVYSWLASRILSGTFRPGVALSELAIVEQVGASRTPVREALRRLERDGLVKLAQGRGAVVADVTEREVRDIYLCREYLSGLTARLTAERITSDQLARFRTLLDGMAHAVADADLPHFFRFNVNFGRLMNECADNATLTDLSGSLGMRVMRLRYLSMGLPTRMETSLRLHQERVAAFQRGDGDLAEAITRQLIRGAGVAILRYHFGVNEQGSPIDLSHEISDVIADGI